MYQQVCCVVTVVVVELRRSVRQIECEREKGWGDGCCDGVSLLGIVRFSAHEAVGTAVINTLSVIAVSTCCAHL